MNDVKDSGSLLPPLGERTPRLYDSLVDQLRTFIKDAGFTDVVVGISGGIDSAVVAALAVDAFGSGRMHGIHMPSRYTSPQSTIDARELAENLGIEYFDIPIDSILAEYGVMLDSPMYGLDATRTMQNLQARIRANLLMAFSNQFDWAVLACGNRSEAMVGYMTLFGDTVGAFAPLAPVYKGWVYELAQYRNAQGMVVPDSILGKEPSAELAIGQTDEADLGSYEVLDGILYRIDQGQGYKWLVENGFESESVTRICAQIEKASFKERFSAPGASLPWRVW